MIRRTVVDRNTNGLDSPKEFDELSPENQNVLVEWIHGTFVRSNRTMWNHSSYGLKHVFENDDKGFYITNGQFKGAMDKAGFHAVDSDKEINWHYKIKARVKGKDLHAA